MRITNRKTWSFSMKEIAYSYRIPVLAFPTTTTSITSSLPSPMALINAQLRGRTCLINVICQFSTQGNTVLHLFDDFTRHSLTLIHDLPELLLISSMVFASTLGDQTWNTSPLRIDLTLLLGYSIVLLTHIPLFVVIFIVQRSSLPRQSG